MGVSTFREGPRMWRGAAGVCLDRRGRVLLVLQGKPDERRAWAIPGGGARPGESLETCCIREVREETGYEVAVLREILVKTRSPANPGGRIELRVFAVDVVGGALAIHDPNSLIHAAGWFAPEAIAPGHQGRRQDMAVRCSNELQATRLRAVETPPTHSCTTSSRWRRIP